MKLTPEQSTRLKLKFGLTDFEMTQLKAELLSFSAQSNQAADGVLAKIGKSQYTWLIIIGIIAAAWALSRIA
ncbi:MAG: hypothetical protein KGN35_07600 [Betaproteobacteria bacterium]|nr:hypothetical protein [Betaproteobacteria bacterium]